jgi:hypothetical protein
VSGKPVFTGDFKTTDAMAIRQAPLLTTPAPIDGVDHGFAAIIGFAAFRWTVDVSTDAIAASAIVAWFIVTYLIDIDIHVDVHSASLRLVQMLFHDLPPFIKFLSNKLALKTETVHRTSLKIALTARFFHNKRA